MPRRPKRWFWFVLLAAPHAAGEADQPAAVKEQSVDSPPAAVQDQAIETPPSDPPFRIEALGGAGFGDVTLPTQEAINSYGGAIGVRLGYTFPFGGHLALRYDHFFGTTASYALPLVALTEYHTGASFIGADLGFEIPLDPAVFRPHVGLGAAAIRLKVTCDPVTSGRFGALPYQLCDSVHRSETDWGFAAVPGFLMGVKVAEFYGLWELRYYARDEAHALGVFGGVGWML